ncbi:hypothetical protein EVAR_52340_1 [Eumeta japonica]|uniref:Uncharacterized protein n=1 Tax=Eumeta variegata TaxID=151549 RepID=A0A4C1Y266_EUMVA|nr:hypothetical protein EVAR_52340_1 [Eumeta japonica]
MASARIRLNDSEILEEIERDLDLPMHRNFSGIEDTAGWLSDVDEEINFEPIRSLRPRRGAAVDEDVMSDESDGEWSESDYEPLQRRDPAKNSDSEDQPRKRRHVNPIPHKVERRVGSGFKHGSPNQIKISYRVEGCGVTLLSHGSPVLQDRLFTVSCRVSARDFPKREFPGNLALLETGKMASRNRTSK